MLKKLQNNRRAFAWQLTTLRIALALACITLTTFSFLGASNYLIVSNTILTVAIARLLWDIRTWK